MWAQDDTFQTRRQENQWGIILPASLPFDFVPNPRGCLVHFDRAQVVPDYDAVLIDWRLYYLPKLGIDLVLEHAIPYRADRRTSALAQIFRVVSGHLPARAGAWDWETEFDKYAGAGCVLHLAPRSGLTGLLNVIGLTAVAESEEDQQPRCYRGWEEEEA
jgi:hypothetical protein